MFRQLKDKIVSMVSAGISLEQQVFNYEESELTGDPAITVTPSANESDYHSDKDNIRIYAFTLRLWVDRTKRGDANCEAVMTELVDAVIDLFDRYYTLGTGSPGNALSVPTGYAMIRTEAMPSTWMYVDRGESSYRLAEIVVRCHVHADVTLISS